MFSIETQFIASTFAIYCVYIFLRLSEKNISKTYQILILIWNQKGKNYI